MILIIDNYDSFTYNLYQLVGKYTDDIKVIRNDKTTINEIEKLNPTHIIISPGPGNPENEEDFGICHEILDEFKMTPILGVCLGHQGIYSHYGVCEKENIPDDIKVTSYNKDGIIMAIEHVKYPTYGIQFHPESISSSYGDEIIRNFLDIK